MTSDEEFKSLRILTKTHERLSNYGKKSETFDDILNRLLDEVEKKGE